MSRYVYVHICLYFCSLYDQIWIMPSISVHICAYLCMSVYFKQHLYMIRRATELRAHATWRLCLSQVTESHTAKGNSLVNHQYRFGWHGQSRWANSWPRSWCNRGGCQILAGHPCCRYHIHSMLLSCSRPGRPHRVGPGDSLVVPGPAVFPLGQRAQEAVLCRRYHTHW